MRVFIIAGEPSGDALGARLMQGLRHEQPDMEFDGIGGPEMQAQGLESRVDMRDLSVMGLVEILPRYRLLKKHIQNTVEDVLAAQPDVLITIDAPEFSFRVARKVKARSDVRTVHYVAPTVWAWRPARAAKISRYIDHLLALFPFEPPFFTKHGMSCEFVGHPVVAEEVGSTEDAARFRATHGIAEAPLLAVLPGSRANEVVRLKDVFGASLALLIETHPDLRVVVPAAEPVADLVLDATKSWPLKPVVLDPRQGTAEQALTEKRAAFRAADVALAASGTVSLELAAARTPMVIAYRLHPLSFAIMKRLVRVETVTLVNLVSETNAVPEFLGPACQVAPIAQALRDTIADSNEQMVAMESTMSRLGAGQEAPHLRAARSVLAFLKR